MDCQNAEGIMSRWRLSAMYEMTTLWDSGAKK